MDTINALWNSGPLAQAFMVAGIVVATGLVVATVSAILPFTVPVMIQIVSTAVLSGVVVYALNSGGEMGLNEGEEIPPVVEEGAIIDLEATELPLEYQIEESKGTFTFLFGKQKLNMNNWKNDFNQKIQQYPNLTTINVKNSNGIPHNYWVELKEVADQNEEILFIGLN